MTIDNQTISWLVTVLTLILGTAGVGGLIQALKTKRKINKTRDEEKKTRAEAAQVIEDTAARQVQRVERAAERAEAKVLKAETEAERIREESNKWESECSLLRGEVNALTCRLNTDMESCKREIQDLQTEVRLLKEKNGRLLKAVEGLVKQVRQRGEIPNCPQDFIGEGE